MLLPALTVIEPWASAIMAGVKPVENRSWYPPARLIGRRFIVHAGKSTSHLNSLKIRAEVLALWPEMPNAYHLGHLLGHVKLTGVDTVESRKLCLWTCGPVPWCLADPVKLATPHPYRGAQGIFYIDSDDLPEGLIDLGAFA